MGEGGQMNKEEVITAKNEYLKKLEELMGEIKYELEIIGEIEINCYGMIVIRTNQELTLLNMITLEKKGLLLDDLCECHSDFLYCYILRGEWGILNETKYELNTNNRERRR